LTRLLKIAYLGLLTFLPSVRRLTLTGFACTPLSHVWWNSGQVRVSAAYAELEDSYQTFCCSGFIVKFLIIHTNYMLPRHLKAVDHW